MNIEYQILTKQVWIPRNGRIKIDKDEYSNYYSSCEGIPLQSCLECRNNVLYAEYIYCKFDSIW